MNNDKAYRSIWSTATFSAHKNKQSIFTTGSDAVGKMRRIEITRPKCAKTFQIIKKNCEKTNKNIL